MTIDPLFALLVVGGMIAVIILLKPKQDQGPNYTALSIKAAAAYFAA